MVADKRDTDQDLGNVARIINSQDPVNPQDAATKNYVDVTKKATVLPKPDNYTMPRIGVSPRNALEDHEHREEYPKYPAALREWRAALGQRYVSGFPIDVLISGHSIAEGYYATTRERRWVNLLLNRLHGSFGPGGVDSGLYTPAIAGIGMASGWTDKWTRVGVNKDTSNYSSLAFGLGARFFYMTANGDSAEYRFVGDRVWFLYTEGSGMGGMNVKIDGNLVAQIDTYRASGGISGKKWDSGWLGRGPHVLRIEPAPYGAQPTRYQAIVEGAIHFDGEHDRGIRVWEGAHAGYIANNFISNSTALYYGSLRTGSAGAGATVVPKLCISQFGTNEYGSSTAVASFKTTMQNHLGVLGATGASIVLIADWSSGGNKADATPRTDAGWQPYHDVMYELADANPTQVCVFDELLLGGSFVGNVDQFGESQDYIHPNDRGSQMIADALCAFLGVPSQVPVLQKTPASRLATVGAFK